MKTTTPERIKLEQIHSEILTSQIFRHGEKCDEIELPAKLIELADAISADDSDGIWSVGEYSEAPLDALVIGAYWALTEWHGGQSSDTYAAMCALGRIFKPGCTSTPTEEDESAEWDAYDAINQHFAKINA